ncbi:pyridoxal-dependent decarboxylase protein [Purpureocillium lilacinum]|uniref:Pyridoxal-dependent decarboxylase protein n=1 Tax=Purpureocillium lilacinum TaxID=33203 RepID=A0A179G349_PURLI|nr:pyridoxal-dependent decarboxylase protein [Purpureocillium lilacinum]OAQ71880.1 pyridoxal-dependent decarboxylase protein [Purpureocillium lilacinum]
MASHELQRLIQREFVSHDNISSVLETLYGAIEMGVQFKAREKVIEHLPLDTLAGKIMQPIPETGQNLSETLQEFQETVLRHSTNFGSKNFMAFPDCGNSVSALAGAFLMNCMNQNLINSKHCAPAASMVEINVIQWLRELVGYTVKRDVNNIFDVGGTVVTGGVLANATAMLMARERAFPGTKDKGTSFDPSRVRVILPQYVEHYSIRASLGWLGLGEENVIRVRTKDFRIDLSDLEHLLEDNAGNYHFMAIVAYAGDSRSMTIDNFAAVHELAKKHNIWFHIDACHGLQYAFSDALKPRLGDIHLGDSITIDPHKILFLPYNLSAVLVKDPESFRAISGTSDLIMKENYAFGQMTPFIGSKAFWSLKLWFTWKTLGRKNIGDLIERRHNLAAYLTEQLQQCRDFLVLNHEVNINSVMFMYKPSHFQPDSVALDDYVQRLNELNKEIQNTLFCEGDFYVHTFSIPDLGNVVGTGERMLQPLRYMCGNPLTAETDIDALISRVRKLGQTVEHKYSYHEVNQLRARLA